MSTINPPGPKGSFLIGSLRAFTADRLGFLTLCQQYGDIVYARLGPRRFYLLNHPDYVRQLLVEDTDKFHKSPLLKSTSRRIIGEGLLTSEDNLHRRQRKLVQPAFHRQRIATYADVMVEHTTRMLDSWRAGEVVEMKEAMARLTLGIVAKTLFDADVSDDADVIGEAITAGLRYIMGRANRPFIPEWLPTTENRAARRRAKLLDSIILRIIDERRRSGEDKGDLLSMLLATGDHSEAGMTDQQVRDEAMTLFIAGHETTATSLMWTFYLLAQHPLAEAKLRDELAAALGDRLPTADDLARLPYTEMVIKEAMRLYPPAWILPREATADVNIGGYPIKPGSIVAASPYTLHRDSRFFAEPDRFIPERFSPEAEAHLPRYAYFPFGGGPRVCVGTGFAMMEARLVLATIAQRYRLALVAQTVTPEPLVTLRPREALLMKVSIPSSVVSYQMKA